MAITRRGFLTGLLGITAAPAIVRAESLMKLVVPKRQLLLLSDPGIFILNKNIAIMADEALLGPRTKEIVVQPLSRFVDYFPLITYCINHHNDQIVHERLEDHAKNI